MNDTADPIEFRNRAEYRSWLITNHERENGIWIVFKKGNKDFSANDALEESICFGWIDGIMKSIDEKCYKKYFSRRKDTNKWSEKNKSIFERLLRNGLMTSDGIAVYQPKENIQEKEIAFSDKIAMLREVLKTDEKILAIFDSKAPSRKKQLAGFFCEAKTEETRTKRINKIIEALKSNFSGMLY